MSLPGAGVRLAVGRGGAGRVYVAVVGDPRWAPPLPPGAALLAPVLRCGPPAPRPAGLRLPHCATRPTAWTLVLYEAHLDDTGAPCWSRAAVAGEENIASPALVHVAARDLLVLMDELPAGVAVVWEPRAGERAARRLTVELREREAGGALYVADDMLGAAGGRDRDGALRAGPVVLEYTCGGGALRATWRGGCLELPYSRVWAGGVHVIHTGAISDGEPLEVSQVGGARCVLLASSCRRPRPSLEDSACPEPAPLPPGLRARLCTSLDPPARGRDWRVLCGPLGAHYPAWLAARPSPTLLLLLLCELQPPAPRRLLSALALARPDLASLLPS